MGKRTVQSYDGATCYADDCDERPIARGLCSKHYQRMTDHGDITRGRQSIAGDRNPMWKGNSAGYSAAHWRVAAAYGRPSEHPCAECGASATDWSLQHDADPSTLRTELIDGWPHWYSLDIDAYVPRCKKCHGAYDWGHKMATRPRRRDERGRFLPYLDGDG